MHLFSRSKAKIRPVHAYEPDETSKSEWREKGYIVLRNVVPAALLQRVISDIADFRASCGESKDAHGFGDRVGQLHQKVGSCLELADNAPVLEFLRWAFRDEPLLFGSLNFERGTEQAPHIDSIFFYTEPMDAMAGAWFALEDVHPDAGPLFYYEGSHRWPFTRGEDIVRAHPELWERVAKARENRDHPETQALVNELGRRWTEELQSRIARMGAKPVPVLIRKGDCLLWHAQLVHGGLPRNDPALSRRSMVFHYIGRHARLYSFSDFFLSSNQEIANSPGLPMDVRSTGRLAYIRYNYVTRVINGAEVPIML